MRDLLVILGDQLDRDSALFANADPHQDRIWMAEVREESTHVWSHKARIALFLSAMRHFRDELRANSWTVEYREIDEHPATLAGELKEAIAKLKPQRIRCVEPGDYRVAQSLRAAIPDIEFIEDTHFLSSIDDFKSHAKGRKQLRMEFFYREMRRRYGILMNGPNPEGGEWNYDSENRGAFGKQGPGLIPAPVTFAPDALTKQVLKAVERIFATHPGKLEHFDWPVTPPHAEAALQDFLDNRLPAFGEFQDAMWTAQPYLYHSRISAALNLKLLHPRRVIEQAELRYKQGHASLAAVEGFIRQVLGWREYVRGLYWLHMPAYVDMNALEAHEPLPKFYWTGDTEMQCLRAAIGQTLDYGYAHHIQRLMVTGLYALLAGVDPRQLHEWYLAVYVDAVEWVELPNTIGMSQFADGGIMASKPYAATGKYIQRMSNYCVGCRYDPAEATGERACPFTTLYWDFLMRHENRLRANPRMVMQIRNVDRLSDERKDAIRKKQRRRWLFAVNRTTRDEQAILLATKKGDSQMLFRSIAAFAFVCLIGTAAGTTTLRTYLINGRTKTPLMQIKAPRSTASCSARELRLTAVAGSPLRAESCENGRCTPADPNSFTYLDRVGKVATSEIRVGAGDPSAGPIEPVDGPDGKKWLCREDEAAGQCVCIPWFQD